MTAESERLKALFLFLQLPEHSCPHTMLHLYTSTHKLIIIEEYESKILLQSTELSTQIHPATY